MKERIGTTCESCTIFAQETKDYSVLTKSYVSQYKSVNGDQDAFIL